MGRLHLIIQYTLPGQDVFDVMPPPHHGRA